jgi:hypothetical protein
MSNDSNKINWFTEVFAVVSVVVGGVALVGAVLFLNAVVNAWVFTYLWQWYVVSFFQQPELPMAVAFGISLMFSALKGMKMPKKDEPKNDVAAGLAGLILFPVVLLLMGWVGTWFL